MKKTPTDFRNAAIKHNIASWLFRTCSICGEPIGYYFFQDPYTEVIFDNCCICSQQSVSYKSSWEDVAKLYNAQTNEEVIKEFNNFWKFDK